MQYIIDDNIRTDKKPEHTVSRMQSTLWFLFRLHRKKQNVQVPEYRVHYGFSSDYALSHTI